MHPLDGKFFSVMDCRVKPGNDDCGNGAGLRFA
jgi:hypothetical protein